MRKKYRYSNKKYAYAYKILALVGLYCLLPNMRMYASVYPHAFFLHLAKTKIRTRYAYFSGIYLEIFLRCDVTRVLSVVVILLAFETFNLGSVFTKLETFIFTQT